MSNDFSLENELQTRPGKTTRRTFIKYGGSLVAIASVSSLSIGQATAAESNGLNAEYYSSTNLTGLVFTQVDPNVNFNWDLGTPDARLGVDGFSIRWFGQVQPRYSEICTFYTTSDDGVRLWVNNQLLIDKWVDQGGTEWSGSIALESGQQYDLVLEYYENGGGANVRLEWSSPSQAREVIPQSQLIPGPVQALEKLVLTNANFSESTGLYILQPAASPSIVIGLYNRKVQETSGEVRWKIHARGKDLVTQGVFPFQIGALEQKEITLTLAELQQGDFYQIRFEVVESSSGEVVAQQTMGMGAIYPPHEGLRPASPFGIGFGGNNLVLHSEIGKRIGVKWRRGTGPAVDPPIVNPAPGVFWGQTEIDKARAEIQLSMSYGIMPLGYINYNMPWNVEPLADGRIPARHENRPHDMVAHAQMVYRTIAPLQDLIKNWELWNEPWIHSWTWATGTGQDYRDMTRLIWDLVKPEFPDVNLIGGGSTMYNRDIVYALNTENRGYIDGSVSHYSRSVADARIQVTMDKLWSKTQGRAGQWETEVAQFEFNAPKLPDEDRPPYAVARTVAPIYLQHILGAGDDPMHIFWFILEPESAAGPDNAFNIWEPTTNTPKPGSIAYATMTHFLEGCTLVEDVYIKAKSTWGCLFQRQDGKATAALYAEEGYQGTVRFTKASGIKIYDYLGRMVADGSANDVTVTLHPLNTHYLVSNRSVDDMRKLLKHARFNYTTPLTISPLSFTRPLSGSATIDVKVENVSPNTIKTHLTLQAPTGWQLQQASNRLEDMGPGEKRIVSFTATQFTVNADNRYLVGYKAEILGDTGAIIQTQTGEQAIQVAYAPYKTITVDGTLSGWQDVIPVTMAQGSVIYKAWTAWDDQHFYFAAEIPDETQNSNPPYATDKFAITPNADSVQLAFDLVKRNLPDDLLLNDPFYEKAASAHMDHLFIATLANDGTPALHREVAPGTNYQESFYPTSIGGVQPPLGPMEISPAGAREGKIFIGRDEARKVTTYEIAMTWSSLQPLQKRLRELQTGRVHETVFAWSVNTSTSGQGFAYWTKEAGQVEKALYGFSPFWNSGFKEYGGGIITRWGFGK